MTEFVDAWKLTVDPTITSELDAVSEAVSGVADGMTVAERAADDLRRADKALATEAGKLARASKAAAAESKRLAKSLGLTEKEAAAAQKSLDRLEKEEKQAAAAASKLAAANAKAAASLVAVQASARKVKLENLKKGVEGLGKGMKLSFLSGEMLSNGYLALAVAAASAAFAVGKVMVDGVKAYIKTSARATDATKRITEAQTALSEAIGGAILGADEGVGMFESMAEGLLKVTAIIVENKEEIREWVETGITVAAAAFQAWTYVQQAALTPMFAILDVVKQLVGWWARMQLAIVGGVAKISKAFGFFTEDADKIIAKTEEWGVKVKENTDITEGLSVKLWDGASAVRGYGDAAADAALGVTTLGTALSDKNRALVEGKRLQKEAEEAELKLRADYEKELAADDPSQSRDDKEIARQKTEAAEKKARGARGAAAAKQRRAQREARLNDIIAQNEEVLAAQEKAAAQTLAVQEKANAEAIALAKKLRAQLEAEQQTVADGQRAVWDNQVEYHTRMGGALLDLKKAQADERKAIADEERGAVNAAYETFALGLAEGALEGAAGFVEAWVSGEAQLDGFGDRLMVGLGGLLKQLGMASIIAGTIGTWFKDGGLFANPALGVAFGVAALGLGAVLSGAGKEVSKDGGGAASGGGAAKAASTAVRSRSQDRDDRDRRDERPIVLEMDGQIMGEAVRRRGMQAARRGTLDFGGTLA